MAEKWTLVAGQNTTQLSMRCRPVLKWSDCHSLEELESEEMEKIHFPLKDKCQGRRQTPNTFKLFLSVRHTSISSCSTTYLGNNIYPGHHLGNPWYPKDSDVEVGSLCVDMKGLQKRYFGLIRKK